MVANAGRWTFSAPSVVGSASDYVPDEEWLMDEGTGDAEENRIGINPYVQFGTSWLTSPTRIDIEGTERNELPFTPTPNPPVNSYWKIIDGRESFVQVLLKSDLDNPTAYRPVVVEKTDGTNETGRLMAIGTATGTGSSRKASFFSGRSPHLASPLLTNFNIVSTSDVFDQNWHVVQVKLKITSNGVQWDMEARLAVDGVQEATASIVAASPAIEKQRVLIGFPELFLAANRYDGAVAGLDRKAIFDVDFAQAYEFMKEKAVAKGISTLP